MNIIFWFWPKGSWHSMTLFCILLHPMACQSQANHSKLMRFFWVLLIPLLLCCNFTPCITEPCRNSPQLFFLGLYVSFELLQKSFCCLHQYSIPLTSIPMLERHQWILVSWCKWMRRIYGAPCWLFQEKKYVFPKSRSELHHYLLHPFVLYDSDTSRYFY